MKIKSAWKWMVGILVLVGVVFGAIKINNVPKDEPRMSTGPKEAP